MSTESLKNAQALLDRLRHRQHRIELIRAVVLPISALLILMITLIIWESVFPTVPVARTTGISLVFVITAVIATLSSRRFKNDIRIHQGKQADEYWALELGQFSSQKIRDRLLNAIQINSPSTRIKEEYSRDLAHHALLMVVNDMRDIEPDEAIDSKPLKTTLQLAGISVIAFLLPFLVAPQNTSSALTRVMHPAKVYQFDPPFELAIDPEGGWAYRGEEVTFNIRANGTAPKRAEFVYWYDGGAKQVSDVLLRDSVNVLTFGGFPEPINYAVRAKDVSTAQYRLNIVNRPQISELQYRLFPPQYTRLSMEIGQANVGNVEAFPGSRLELQIRATKNLSKAWIVYQSDLADTADFDTTLCEISGSTVSAKFKISEEGSYHIRLQDDQSHYDSNPVHYKVSLLRDDYPAVRIVYPTEDIDLGDSYTVPMLIEADDDFGVSRMKLAYKHLTRDSTITFVDVELDNPGAPTVSANHFWDLESLFLMPGDVVEYWTVVWDNDNVSGPKRAESEHRMVRLPSFDEIYTEVTETEERGFEQAEETLKNAEELKENLQEVLEEMKRNPEMDWEKQRQLEDAMEMQKNLEKQVEELANTIEELTEKLEKHDLSQEETLKKYQELQKLIEEIATPEMKEAMEKLREAMEEQDPDAIRQALEEFEFNQEEFLQRIERNMEILKQLQIERRLDELVKQLEEILHDQEESISQMEGDRPETEIEKQNKQAESTETFHNRLDETIALTEEAREMDLAGALDSLSAEMTQKDLPGKMREAASDLARDNVPKAKESSEQTARELSEMISKLSQTSKNFKEQKKNEIARKMRRLVDELLFLSHDQENLRDVSKNLGTQSPRYPDLAGRQEELRRALDGVMNRMFEISKETFFITSQLGAALGKAAEELDNAVEKYTSRYPMNVDRYQESAMGQINLATWQLLEILNQMQGSSSSTGYEEMMEQLSQMAQQQQGLNEQSMPMPMPGQQGQPQMPGGQSMARMAAEQRALQAQMEQLAEEGKGMQEILGNLDEIAANMGEVADDLNDKNVTNRTRRLQRQIVSRLLDATRSARQKEYSKKRESKSGFDVTRRPPPELQLDSDTEKLRRDLKRALQEGYTRDYRRLIRQYFQALEQVEQEDKTQGM